MTLSERTIRTLETVALLLALAPFIILAGSAHPAADDYCFAERMRDMGFWAAARTWYMDWTGRFASILMINLGPLSFDSLAAYEAMPVLLMAALYVAMIGFGRAVAPELSRRTTARHALFALVLYLNTLSSPAESLFWYAGAIIFTWGSVCALAAVTAGIRAARATSTIAIWGWTLLATLATLMAAGSNEVTMLLLFVIIGAAVVKARVRGSRALRRWALTLTAATLAVLANLAAPGNARRAEITGGVDAVVGPMFGSAVVTGSLIIDWLSHSPILVALVALVAAGMIHANRIGPDAPWKRTHWMIPVAMVVAGVWAGLFLTHWASGFVLRPGPPERVVGVLLLYFLATAGLAAFMAGCQMPGPQGLEAWAPPTVRRWIPLVIALLMFGTGNVHDAWVDVVAGRARTYDAELHARYDQLRSGRARGDSVTVLPLSRMPPTIHVRDITPDPSDWRNVCYARYWHVPAVRLAD